MIFLHVVQQVSCSIAKKLVNIRGNVKYGLLVLEETFTGFYHIQEWRPY